MSTVARLRFAKGSSLHWWITASVLCLPVFFVWQIVQGEEQADNSRSRPPETRFSTLQAAVAYAEQKLEIERNVPVAILVYSVRGPEGVTEFVQTELHFVGGGQGGYIPKRIQTGDFVVQSVTIRGSAQPVSLHVILQGCERFVRRDILRAGELVVWDDIVPTPITESSAASIVGRVRVEDGGKDLEGLVIDVDDEPVAFTDASGYFVADRVRPGKLRVATHITGFVGAYAEVTVAPGQEAVCELIGYRQRTARVRWTYQPDGTRRFDGAVVTGTAILTPNELSRVSFAKGFAQVDGRSDFWVSQVKDQLVLRHFDAHGPKYPSSILLKDAAFDGVHEAPEAGYSRRTVSELRPGDVFVFRCFDGDHYGKLEVLEIVKENPSRETR